MALTIKNRDVEKVLDEVIRTTGSPRPACRRRETAVPVLANVIPSSARDLDGRLA